MANKEIGRIGQRRYGGTIYEEFLHELRGTRGIEVYREMSENDDVVGAILFAIEMLVRQCDWNVEPGGDTAKDKEAAEFVESCMHDMQDTWTDTISEILSFLTYGWSFHEIVYKRRMGWLDWMEEIAYQSAGNALPMGIRQRGQSARNDSDAASGLWYLHDTNE